MRQKDLRSRRAFNVFLSGFNGNSGPTFTSQNDFAQAGRNGHYRIVFEIDGRERRRDLIPLHRSRHRV
jgi:hypothetical protein